jgi:hypothetical protein
VFFIAEKQFLKAWIMLPTASRNKPLENDFFEVV